VNATLTSFLRFIFFYKSKQICQTPFWWKGWNNATNYTVLPTREKTQNKPMFSDLLSSF